MLLSTNEFVKNYYWRYVDMHINRYELEFLQSRTVQDSSCRRFLNRYRHMLSNPEIDIENLCSVLSHINDSDLRTFLKFFVIRIRMIKEDSTSEMRLLRDYEDLQRYIEEDEELFNFFVVSLYYYF
jgi:hypothetical protein